MLPKITIPILLTTFLVATAFLQAGGASARPVMLIHGNYCGPGNNAPLPPIDALDAACARHDACTPDVGLPSKACNLRLQAEAEGVASDGRQPEELRMMAGLVASGAAMMPFKPPGALAGVAASPTIEVAHRPGVMQRSRLGVTVDEGH